MSNYKLVPMEPTAHMLQAACDEERRPLPMWSRMKSIYTAMLAAAPAVQGEPVAYAVFAENGNIRIWCADPIQAKTLRQQYGEALQPLYTAPQPAEQPSDVTQLVEALELLADTLDEGGWPGAALVVARSALAAHRKQRGETRRDAAPSHSQQSAEYRCHKCGTETPPPEPFKAYVKCACGTLTAATAALADDRCPAHDGEKGEIK